VSPTVVAMPAPMEDGEADQVWRSEGCFVLDVYVSHCNHFLFLNKDE